ncbi:hypothetical protein GCM10027162_12420 [Streptomyces incanus]
MGGGVVMVSLVAEINKARQRRTAGQQYPQVQDGAVVEFRSQSGCRTGDGTDGRTGWPAVIRGRREQDPAAKSVSSTSVKASAAGARTGQFGSGVPSRSRRRTGDGAGCRRVALSQATSSSQYQQCSSQYQQCKQYAVPAVGK